MGQPPRRPLACRGRPAQNSLLSAVQRLKGSNRPHESAAGAAADKIQHYRRSQRPIERCLYVGFFLTREELLSLAGLAATYSPKS